MNALEIEPAAFFAALADPTRFRLVELLARQPEGAALCVNALAARLGISQPAVSQHLQVLRGVGLVRATRQGPRVHYRLDRARLELGQALLRDLSTIVVETQARVQDEPEQDLGLGGHCEPHSSSRKESQP